MYSTKWASFTGSWAPLLESWPRAFITKMHQDISLKCCQLYSLVPLQVEPGQASIAQGPPDCSAMATCLRRIHLCGERRAVTCHQLKQYYVMAAEA